MRCSRTNPAAFDPSPDRARALAPRPRGPRPTALAHAFTLIETSLAIIIVSTGVLAIVAAEQAYHQQNNASLKIGTALMLANEVREMTLSLPSCDPILGKEYFGPEPGETAVAQYNDLDDFAGPTGGGITINPPIDANRN